MTNKEFKSAQRKYVKQLPSETKRILKAIRNGKLIITSIKFSNEIKAPFNILCKDERL